MFPGISLGFCRRDHTGNCLAHFVSLNAFKTPSEVALISGTDYGELLYWLWHSDAYHDTPGTTLVETYRKIARILGFSRHYLLGFC